MTSSSKKFLDVRPELLAVKNAIYLGDYGLALSTATQISFDGSDEESKLATIEKEVLLHRAHIGLQQYDVVLAEIQDDVSTALPLRAVRLLAYYYANQSSPKHCQEVIDKLEEWYNDPALAGDTVLATVAAAIYAHEGNLIAALKCVHNPSTLELVAIQVSLYLQLNRIDHAQETLTTMMQMNDDATITLLTTAYVALAKGSTEMLQQAAYIFNDLLKKFEGSLTVLNGIATCQMQNSDFSGAEKTLLSALAKRSSDPETLINLIVCLQHLKKPKDLISRYVNQLKTVSPKHHWIKTLADAEASFDKFSVQYKFSNK